MSERITSLLLIAVVALGAMTGVAAADGHLEVAVEDADDEPTVTVTQNNTAVENATVVVSVVDAENESYAGSGEYQTDANGSVDLPTPEKDITVDVTASDDERTVSTTVELTADEEEDDTAEGTPFGQLMRDFIENISDREGGIGAVVSDFATENNPGNASDDAGDGNDDDGNASDDGERGPPDHAGPDGDDAEDDETEADDTEEEDVDDDDAEADEDDAEADEDDEDDDEDDDDAEEDDGDDGKSGPPDRAGGPGDN